MARSFTHQQGRQGRQVADGDGVDQVLVFTVTDLYQAKLRVKGIDPHEFSVERQQRLLLQPGHQGLQGGRCGYRDGLHQLPVV